MAVSFSEEVFDRLPEIVRGESHDCDSVSLGIGVYDDVLGRIVSWEVCVEGDSGVVTAGEMLVGLEAVLSGARVVGGYGGGS